VYQLFMPHCKRYVGGVETVRRIIMKGPGAGFGSCIDIQRPDLLAENLVLNPKWQHLFEPEVQKKARESLASMSR
jgi:hypothetical protein